MPTEIIHRIAATGGDYSDPVSWEAGEQRDLVNSSRASVTWVSGVAFPKGEALSFAGSGATATALESDGASFVRYVITAGTPTAGDTISGASGSATLDAVDYVGEIAVGEVEGEVSFTSLVVAGWGSNATYRPILRNAPGHEHGGLPNTGARLKSTDWNVDCISLQSSSAVEGLGIYSSNSGVSSLINLKTGGTLIKRCVGYNLSVAGGSGQTMVTGFAGLASGWGRLCEDSIIIGQNSSAAGKAAFKGIYGNIVSKIDGCVAANSTRGFFDGGGGNKLSPRNCVAFGCTEDFPGAYDAYASNNASSGAGAPGAGSIQGITSAEFADAAGLDFHLAPGSQLIGAGANRSAAVSAPIDIDGDVRPSTGAWDIGFDHYLANGAVLSVAAVYASAALSTASATQGHDLNLSPLYALTSLNGVSVACLHALAVAIVEAQSELSGLSMSQHHDGQVAGLNAMAALQTVSANQGHLLAATGIAAQSFISAISALASHDLSTPRVEAVSELTPVELAQLHELSTAFADAVSSILATEASQLHGLTLPVVEAVSDVSQVSISSLHNLVVSSLDVIASVSGVSAAQTHDLYVTPIYADGDVIGIEVSQYADKTVHVISAKRVGVDSVRITARKAMDRATATAKRPSSSSIRIDIQNPLHRRAKR